MQVIELHIYSICILEKLTPAFLPGLPLTPLLYTSLQWRNTLLEFGALSFKFLICNNGTYLLICVIIEQFINVHKESLKFKVYDMKYYDKLV